MGGVRAGMLFDDMRGCVMRQAGTVGGMGG